MRWILRKASALRNNNGALQVRVLLDGQDHFVNSLGRFDALVARARAVSISAKICRDFQWADFDATLNGYCPLVDGKDLDLLEALKQLME